jgi:hypothetical protein
LVEHDVQVFVGALYDVTLGTRLPFRHFEPYVTSFCGHTDSYEVDHGLLSQWRGYGSDAGYALVFDTVRLEEVVEVECKRYFYSSAHLGTVVYDGDQEMFDREFAELISVVNKMSEQMFLHPHPDLSPLYTPLVGSLSRYKHKGFREEREVRLVVSPMSQKFIDHMNVEDPQFTAKHAGKAFKPRHNRPNLASYVALFGDKPLPIPKIIVGPHVNKEMQRVRLQRYIELLGLEIDVQCSQTPLVG